MKRTTWRCFGDRPPRSLSHIETTRPRGIDWLQPWSRTPSCTSPPTVLMYGRILVLLAGTGRRAFGFAYEVADKRVAPHVVARLASWAATTRPGDEALGLTRVLLQLGAQCVVAGVAQVADDLAGRVMADYTGGWQRASTRHPRWRPRRRQARTYRSSASVRRGTPTGAVPARPLSSDAERPGSRPTLR